MANFDETVEAIGDLPLTMLAAMTCVVCPDCGEVYMSERSPSCPHDDCGPVVTVRLQERDTNGHGKRRRKRRPSAQCCEIHLPGGGIRGTSELEKLVDSGKFKVAFSLYPVTLDQLFAVADSGNVMPPKSTWFEPKLRSGVVVHII